jgi:hypothetical protein
MIMSALFLALLVGAGFAILYAKLPPTIKRFLNKRYILLDIFIAWAVFSMIGFAIVGIYAAGFICLFVSLYLWYINKVRPPPEPEYKARWSIRTCAKLYNTLKGR